MIIYQHQPDEIPTTVATLQPDEDFWKNLVAPLPFPVAQKLPILLDPDELPAGRLFGQDDEDFWRNPVAPMPAPAFQRLPIAPDPDEIPVGFLHGQPDEDFWINPIAPIFPINRIPQPGVFDDQDPAAQLHGQPDEDFWANPVRPTFPVMLVPAQSNFENVEVPTPPPPAIAEEDFWRNAVRPVEPESKAPALWAADVQESAATLFGQADEDHWRSPLLPEFPKSAPYAFAEKEEFSTVAPLEEYEWRAPRVNSDLNRPFVAAAGDEILALIFEEDFWQRFIVQEASANRARFEVVEDLPSQSMGAVVVDDAWNERPSPSREAAFRDLRYGQDEILAEFVKNSIAAMASVVTEMSAFAFEPRVVLIPGKEKPADPGSVIQEITSEAWVTVIKPVKKRGPIQ